MEKRKTGRTRVPVLGLDDALERVVDLRSDLHGFAEAARPGGEEHELLEHELVGRVFSTIDDVESRAREREGWFETCEIGEVVVQREALASDRAVYRGVSEI